MDRSSNVRTLRTDIRLLPPAPSATSLDGPAPTPLRPAVAGSVTRVFVLAHDALVRTGMRAMLAGAATVEVVGDGEIEPRAQAELLSSAPDVLVLHDAALVQQARLMIEHLDPIPRIVVVGGDARPDDRHCVHGLLPASVAGAQLAAAIELASSGYRVLRDDIDPDVGPEAAVAVADEDETRPAAGTAARRVTTGASLAALTDREREVLVGIASGLSNAGIAAELTVSEHTVKSHVRSVLHKLDLPNRVHAVIHAYESGLR